jgi:hypothetical protein
MQTKVLMETKVGRDGKLQFCKAGKLLQSGKVFELILSL